jgi:hypothetical protein
VRWRTLFSRRVALLTLGCLATSHYLLAYGHTGYPNLEALLPGVMAMLLFVVGIRGASPTLLFASGVTAGLGWYTYYSARTAIVVLVAAALVVIRPGRWITVATPLAVGFALSALPLFTVSKLDVWTTMFEQTGSGTPSEVAANPGLLVEHGPFAACIQL